MNSNLEEIPPYFLDNSDLIEKVQFQIDSLQLTFDKKSREIKKAPPGKLRLGKSHNTIQYFQVLTKADPKGVYIPKNNTKLLQELAQKDYNLKIVKILTKQLSQLRKIKRTLKALPLKKINLFITSKRKKLINPATLSDCTYTQLWQKNSYQKKDFYDDTPEFYTTTGLRVRSKSEILIADTLTRFSVPFQYEYPVTLKDNQNKEIILHPDFLCLNLRTRKEFLWEHFGMMNNEEYAQKAIKKQNLYIKNNYIPGRNLILTMESQNTPINTKMLEKIINEYLL